MDLCIDYVVCKMIKILSQLIKTGLGLKLIFGDFSFRELFSSDKKEEDHSFNMWTSNDDFIRQQKQFDDLYMDIFKGKHSSLIYKKNKYLYKYNTNIFED